MECMSLWETFGQSLQKIPGLRIIFPKILEQPPAISGGFWTCKIFQKFRQHVFKIRFRAFTTTCHATSRHLEKIRLIEKIPYLEKIRLIEKIRNFNFFQHL